MGTLWKRGVALQQAHLFSAPNHGLALNFFHLAPVFDEEGEPVSPCSSELNQMVEQAIVDQQHFSEVDEAALPDVARKVTLTEWRPGLFRLRAETDQDIGALLYLLCLKAGRRLGGDIHGLTAHTGRDGAWASVYLSLPQSFGIDDARRIVEAWG